MLLALDSSAGASAAVVHHGTVLAARRTAETTSHAEVLAPAAEQVLAEAGLTGGGPGQAPAHAQGGQLEAVVVGVGPGPFTGLRVGLVLAHSLAETWGVPAHGVCSLDSIALRALRHGIAEERFLAVTDARRREVYAALYERPRVESGAGSLLPLGQAPFVTAPAEAPEVSAVGAGVGLYPELLRPARFEEPDTGTGSQGEAVVRRTGSTGEDGSDRVASDASAWLPDAVELALIAEQALLPEEAQTAGAASPVQGRVPSPLRDPLPLYLRESDARVPKQMQKGSPV